MIDDSLAKDQLSLWKKLNRLYGDESTSQSEKEKIPGKKSPVPEQEAHPEERSETGPGLSQTEKIPILRPSELCVECDQDCKQPEDNFILARCRKAVSETEIQSGTQAQSMRTSMGYEKTNETCKRCRKSCKQTMRKLNIMLCLGFEPLTPEKGSS